MKTYLFYITVHFHTISLPQNSKYAMIISSQIKIHDQLKLQLPFFKFCSFLSGNVYQHNKQSEWMLLITIKTHLSYSTSHMHNIFLCLRAEENHNVNEYEYCF